jgi:hypothetical protein
MSYIKPEWFWVLWTSLSLVLASWLILAWLIVTVNSKVPPQDPAFRYTRQARALALNNAFNVIYHEDNKNIRIWFVVMFLLMGVGGVDPVSPDRWRLGLGTEAQELAW